MPAHDKVPASDDEAFDTRALCKRFKCSRWTLNDWREKHGFPQPDFYVGTRGYTWLSTIDAWSSQMPRERPATSSNLINHREDEHAHQAA
jgi:hypothetical protein